MTFSFTSKKSHHTGTQMPQENGATAMRATPTGTGGATRALKTYLAVSVTFLTLLAGLLGASPALAARPHEFTGEIGKPCLAEPCTGEELKAPTGVAVNEATGDIYVVEPGTGAVGTPHGRVVEFSAAGKVELEIDGSGANAWEKHAAGSLGQTGEVPTGAFENPETIAVDNTCVLQKWSEPKCKEEDPSAGDVYVVDGPLPGMHRVVDKYSPTGEYLGQITEGEGNPIEEPGVKQRFHRTLDGVAIDPEGHVWVYQETRGLQEYEDTAQNGFLGSKGISVQPPGEPGFAIDEQGNFYLRHELHNNYLIAKVEPSGKVVREELLPEEDSNSVAANQLTSNILIDNDMSLAVLNPEGTAVEERLGEEHGVKHLTKAAGIGVNASGANGSVFYVADAGAGVVDVFGPAEPAPPQVREEAFSDVTSSTAILAGEVGPNSEPGEAATTYRFEYAACASLATCSSASYAEVPGSAGEVPADFGDHAVTAKLTGLQPDTTYRFRLVARNGHDPEPQPATGGKELTFTTESAGGELVLPDNRGWELVSPPDKRGASIEPLSEEGVVQAAAGGSGITYLTNSPTEAEPAGYTNDAQVLSSRSSTSWSSRDIAIPHSAPTGLANGPGAEYKFFDPELTLAAVQPIGPFDPLLSVAASESTAYLRNTGVSGEACTPTSPCYVPLVTRANDTSDPFQPFGEEGRCEPNEVHKASEVCGPIFLGATEDLSHVVLRAKAALTLGAVGEGLYEWSGGALALVSALPDGEPSTSENSLGDEVQGAARRAISNDGQRVVWGTHDALYLRDMARGETVQLDAAAAGCSIGTKAGECQSGGGVFQIASVDGSRVFFTDINRLTGDSGAEPRGANLEADLYECDVAAIVPGEENCGRHLTDLTPAHGTEAAEVQGSVLGASEDGSYLYFVANGVLDGGANARGERAQPGDCQGTPPPISARCNLYLDHEGAISFITTLAGGDEHDWDGNQPTESLAHQPTRVSPDGRYLELMSEASLTGYDNRDVDSATGARDAEVYLYDATTNKLVCASCEPSGERPVGVEYRKLTSGEGGLVGDKGIWPGPALVAANVPGWTKINIYDARYQPRYLSNSGRLFFDSADALVPQDTNGTEDVYEYEPPGITGPAGEADCTSSMSTYSERSGGCVSLISSGSSNHESAFLDASESGDDVFFLTYSKLSPLDTDDAADVYDAHVCTAGSPCIVFPNIQSPPCTTEASCKAPPTPQPSIFGSPASATFIGPGNLTPAAAVKPKAKPLTRAQKLAAALKTCKKDKKKSKRQACEKQARAKYGPAKKKAKAKKSAKGRK
jgi:hypothetical protein